MKTSRSAFRRSPLMEVAIVLTSVGIGVCSFIGIRNIIIMETGSSIEWSSKRLSGRLEKKLRDGREEEDLQAAAERLTGFRADDTRFLCIIDAQGRCVVHSRRPELVGEFIMSGEFTILKTGRVLGLQDILHAEKSLVGWYTSPGGEKQLVALTPMAGHRFLLGIHVPRDQVLGGFDRIAGPMAALWGVFSLVFLPWLLMERRRTALATENLLESTLNQIPDVIWTTEGNPPKVSYVSPACEKLTGFTPTELMSTPMFFRSRVDDADQDRYQQALHALAGGQVIEEEFRYHRKDGEVIWLSIRVSPTLDLRGRLIRTDGVCTDVTRHKRAEMAVREEEAHYRSLVERAEIVLVRISPAGQFLYMSPQAQRNIGYTAEELMADPSIFDRIVFEEDRDKLALLRETRRRMRCEPVEVELRYRHRDGTTQWMYEKQVPVTDEVGAIIYYDISAMNITARKTLEEQLLKSQKMETLGNLATGVAHDFNNILTIISGATELIDASLAAGEDIQPNLEELRRATDQAADMVHGLLSFGRKRRMRRHACDLQQVVEDGMRVIRRAIPPHIKIRIEKHQTTEPIYADAGQLQQALLNLCLHAREAMPAGGTLMVSTDMVTIEKRQVTVRPEIRPGRFAMLRVSETGSQKSGGEANGELDPKGWASGGSRLAEFGLATTYQIVRDHAGWIDTQADPERGMTVTIYLPVVDAPRSKGGHTSERGSESILVAGAEPMVAGFIKTVLEQRGYRVATADCVESALDLLSPRMGGFSAVIIDSQTGDADRLRCLHRLRELNPTFGAVMISGGTPNAAMAAELENPLTTFLQKPFQAADLAQTLRLLLDRELIES